MTNKKNIYRHKRKKSTKGVNHQHKNSVKEIKKLTFYNKIIKMICEPNKFIHLLIATVAVIIGFIFNAIDEMPLFWLKGMFGFVLYLLLCYTIRYMEEKNEELEIELTGDPLLVKCQTEYSNKVYSNKNIILCILACIYFPTISTILGFVKTNPIGIYSLFALDIVVFMAFIIFQQYIHIMILLYQLSKIKPGKFFELIPEKTEWLNQLEEYSGSCRNIFIILGSLFILLFIIFSPVNSIQIIFYDKVLSYQFVPLLCTWIIILIAIIFMIPFSSYVRSYFLQKIYDNLVSQSLNNYMQLFEKSSENSRITYIDIMLRINDRKYTLKSSYAWVIPVVASISNFSSIIISIIADLTNIGLLR